MGGSGTGRSPLAGLDSGLRWNDGKKSDWNDGKSGRVGGNRAGVTGKIKVMEIGKWWNARAGWTEKWLS